MCFLCKSVCSENFHIVLRHFLASGESNSKLRPTIRHSGRELCFVCLVVSVHECSLCVEAGPWINEVMLLLAHVAGLWGLWSAEASNL